LPLGMLGVRAGRTRTSFLPPTGGPQLARGPLLPAPVQPSRCTIAEVGASTWPATVRRVFGVIQVAHGTYRRPGGGGPRQALQERVMPSLEMVQGGPPGFSYPLDGEVTVLGRDPACDIVLADRKVSKRHARVVRKGDGYHIEDLQSTNGTKVGDRDLTGARLLEDGDLIAIGDFRLALSGGGPWGRGTGRA